MSLIGGPGLLAYGGDAVKLYLAHEHWLVCPTHVLWRHNREPCDAKECLRCQLQYRRPPQLWRYTGLLDRRLGTVSTVHRHERVQPAEAPRVRVPVRHDGAARISCPIPRRRRCRPKVRRPHERPYFLFVGRLERIKGLDDVIETFRDYPDADLLVVGDGTHGATLRTAGGGQSAGAFRRARAGRRARAVLPPRDRACWPRRSDSRRSASPDRSVQPPDAGDRAPSRTVPGNHSRTRRRRARSRPPTNCGARCGGCRRRRKAAPRWRAPGYDAYCTRWSERVVVPRYLEIVDAARAGARAA